jgi:hypothetical protein
MVSFLLNSQLGLGSIIGWGNEAKSVLISVSEWSGDQINGQAPPVKGCLSCFALVTIFISICTQIWRYASLWWSSSSHIENLMKDVSDFTRELEWRQSWQWQELWKLVRYFDSRAKAATVLYALLAGQFEKFLVYRFWYNSFYNFWYFHILAMASCLW